mmetsp:Transcript_9087/g.37130  ORF Transcript_9087/g.37130 Transcript_9087/m.37130 type:complete len:276 (-) Transcript_9087:1933-2760(-)
MAASAYDLCTQSLCSSASLDPRAVAENGLFPTLHSQSCSTARLARLYPRCEGSAPPTCSATAATAASVGSLRFHRASPPSQPTGDAHDLDADCATRTMSGRDTATRSPSMSSGVGSSSASVVPAVASASTTKTGISSATDFFPASFSPPLLRRAPPAKTLSCACTSALSSQCTLRATTFPDTGSSAGDVPDRVAASNAAASAGSSAALSLCVVTVTRWSGSIKPRSSSWKPSTSKPPPPPPWPWSAPCATPPHVPEAPVEPGDAESMYTNTDTRR